MADIVNLNRAKKKKLAAEKEKIADENRAKFGRTKAEKEKAKAEHEMRERHIEGHRRDGEE